MSAQKGLINYEITSAPAVLPVTRSDVKDHMKVDATDEDTLIDVYIEAAREQIEAAIGRVLISTTFRFYFDRWPGAGSTPWWSGTRTGPISALNGEHANAIEFPFGPVQSITHLKTYDDSDNATTFASTKYYADTTGFPGRLVLRTGQTPPTALRVANGYEVEAVLGYGDAPGDVPADLRLAVSKLAAHIYENRGDEGVEADDLSKSGAGKLIRRYQRKRLV